MKRTEVREIAFHLIYEMGFHEFESDEIILERLDESIRQSIAGEIALYAGKLNDKQVNYVLTVVKGVAANLAELDSAIEQNSKGWSLKRLSRISHAILRLAMYEIHNMEDVPAGAAINEAVELAKKYESEEAARFINGILGTIVRAEGVKPEEIAETAAESADE